MAEVKEKHPTWFKMKSERRQLVKELPAETTAKVLLACWEYLETAEIPYFFKATLYGAGERTRTSNVPLTRRVHCQLCYASIFMSAVLTHHIRNQSNTGRI